MPIDPAAPADRVPILAGLDAIEARCLQDYKVAGARATPAQHDALLTLAMNDGLLSGSAFFTAFRQLAGGTEQVLLNVVGERILGLPRD